jgi:uncharacterized protein YktA (UPF0223 family)
MNEIKRFYNRLVLQKYRLLPKQLKGRAEAKQLFEKYRVASNFETVQQLHEQSFPGETVGDEDLDDLDVLA